MHRFGLIAVAATFLSGAASADEMSFPPLMPADIPGAPMLGDPFLVMAGDGPVLTEKHGLAAPALWDWDGDGKRDLLVGEFETNAPPDFPMGADGSTIRVYLNVGTRFGAAIQRGVRMGAGHRGHHHGGSAVVLPRALEARAGSR